jgi:hypothetical protein
MNIAEMDILHQQIKACRKNDCGRNLSPDIKPFLMCPKITQRIMLITQDPAPIIAASPNLLLDENNSFFSNKRQVLGVFFKDYSLENFDIYKTKFEKIVYWTHFSKCHIHGKYPKQSCAASYR